MKYEEWNYLQLQIQLKKAHQEMKDMKKELSEYQNGDFPKVDKKKSISVAPLT